VLPAVCAHPLHHLPQSAIAHPLHLLTAQATQTMHWYKAVGVNIAAP